MALRRQTDGVTTFEHGKRTQRIDRVRGTCKGLMPGSKRTMYGAGQPLLTQFQAVRSHSNECTTPSCLFQPKRKVIDTLTHPADPCLRYDESTAAYFRGEEIPQS